MKKLITAKLAGNLLLASLGLLLIFHLLVLLNFLPADMIWGGQANADNLASGVSAENFILAPITLILALCAFRLAVEK